MLRSQLRHFRQKDTFANYLNKFQELTNRLNGLSDQDKFVAFLDGLSDVLKHEVLKDATCNTLKDAIKICSNYEFCIFSVNNKRESLLTVANFNKPLNQNKFKTPFTKSYSDRSNLKNKFSNFKNNFSKVPPPINVSGVEL